MENNPSIYTDRPTRYSYKVADNFWAGEYPIDKDPQRAVVKLDEIVRFGITDFIDLTEEGELNPYQSMLPSGGNYTRFPTPDCSVPATFEQMDETLQKIDQILATQGRKVYIHCWGGVGRTGTAIACYFVKHGRTPQEALEELVRCFAMNEKSRYRQIPETYSQLKFIDMYYQRLQRKS